MWYERHCEENEKTKHRQGGKNIYIYIYDIKNIQRTLNTQQWDKKLDWKVGQRPHQKSYTNAK